MTAKHLPPDTGRELSALKRRVTDLELMLDRIRRPAPPTDAVTNHFNTPFASLAAVFAPPVPGSTPTLLTPTSYPVEDPTGHIFVDHHDPTHGWFVIKVPGFYEFGATVTFFDSSVGGYRRLAIASTTGDGNLTGLYDIHSVDRSPGTSTIMTGSRIVHVDQSVVLRWHVAVSHTAGGDVNVRCDSFWCRFVTTGTAPPQPSSS